MEEADEGAAKRPVWENHFQSIILAIILGVMAWVGNGVSNGAVTMARQEERIANLTLQVLDMKAALQITSRDFTTRDERINSLEARVREIEHQSKK